MSLEPGSRLLWPKIGFIARKGWRHYRRNGARYFADLEVFLQEAQRAGREVGRVTLDARTSDWAASHPLSKSVLEAAFAAAVIREYKPAVVHDVGSNLILLAALSAFVDVVGLDSREIQYKQPGLSFRKMDARRLPFGDGAIEFLMSLCVVEHIGLGRYGDTLDPDGDRKFVAEARRCLRPGGLLVLSVPVGERTGVAFNAHRIYALSDLGSLTSGFAVEREGFIKSGHESLSREEALSDLKRGSPDQYVVWAAALKKLV